MVLSVIVDETGKVVKSEVVLCQGDTAFASAAVEALLKWTYTPAMKDGRAVKVMVGQTVEFKLKSSAGPPTPPPPPDRIRRSG